MAPVGEDDTIQGTLEVPQVPYTHTGVLAAALAGKGSRQDHMASAGIPVAHGVTVPRVQAPRRHILRLPMW
jgi:D-alanine-D-alanine ligase